VEVKVGGRGERRIRLCRGEGGGRGGRGRGGVHKEPWEGGKRGVVRGWEACVMRYGEGGGGA